MARVIEYNAYRGIHGERRISKEDFASVGVAVDDLPDGDLVWNARNYFLLNVDNLSDHVIKIILGEPGFKELTSRQTEKAVDANPDLAEPPAQ